MSPDGSKVSFLQMHSEDLPILRVLDLTSGKANLALASTRDGFDLQWCDWANNERLLCSFYGVSGVWGLSTASGEYLVTRLVAINADGWSTTPNTFWRRYRTSCRAASSTSIDAPSRQ
jgi:hypothetical protein